MAGEKAKEPGWEAPPKLTLADLRALTPADLRDLMELRREYASLEQSQTRRSQDHARLEGENRFLRDQLALALAGWRDEQRRPRTPMPAPEVIAEVTDGDADETAAPVPPGSWGRLWSWLAD